MNIIDMFVGWILATFLVGFVMFCKGYNAGYDKKIKEYYEQATQDDS